MTDSKRGGSGHKSASASGRILQQACDILAAMPSGTVCRECAHLTPGQPVTCPSCGSLLAADVPIGWTLRGQVFFSRHTREYFAKL